MDRSQAILLAALVAGISCHQLSDRTLSNQAGGSRLVYPSQVSHLQEVGRAASDAPLLYLNHQREKRKCPAGGLFSGSSAFNYVSFVVGILTLVVNINNNINNNNNNNNNNLATNNINANLNSNNANQINIRPSGKRRRRNACNAFAPKPPAATEPTELGLDVEPPQRKNGWKMGSKFPIFMETSSLGMEHSLLQNVSSNLEASYSDLAFAFEIH